MAGLSATRLEPEWAWTKSYGILPGIKVGQVVNTCGVIPLDAEGQMVGKDDARAQVRKVFENIAEILALGGCSLNDITRLTIYLKDLTDFPALKEVRTQFFPNGVPGVVTTVGADLIGDGIKVEIEAVALAPAA